MFSRLGLYLIILLSLLLHTSYAQDDYTITVQQLGLEEGLVHRNVEAIFKDKDGFLWIGTNHSLQRYDGYEFKSYSLNSPKGNFKNIRAIGQTKAGWLWIYCANVKTSTYDIFFFHPFTAEVLTMEEKLGKDLFSQENKTAFFSNYTHTVLLEVKDGLIHWANSEYLNIINIDEKTAKSIKLPYAVALDKPLDWPFLRLIDQDGHYWLFYVEKQLFVQMNSEGEILKEVNLRHKGDVRRDFLINEFDKEIYVCQTERNQAIIDFEKVNSKLYTINTNNQLELAFDIPQTLVPYTMLNGQLWCLGSAGWKIFDTAGNLLFEINRKDYDNSLFERLDNKDILYDEEGRFYQYSHFGFNTINVKKNPFVQYFSNQNGKSLPIKNQARGIWVSNDTIVANFEYGGLVLMKKDKPQQYQIISTLSHTDFTSESYNGRSILRDEKGYYWIGHESRHLLSRWNSDFSKEDKINVVQTVGDYFQTPWTLWEDENACIWGAYDMEFRQFCSGDSLQRIYPREELGINTDGFQIYDIKEEVKGEAWLSTSSGLYLFDTNQKKVLEHYHLAGEGEYQFPVQEFFHMHIDEDGNKWMATRGGLLYWDKATGNKRLFNRNDGLSNDVIYAVYGDEHNRLWMSSDYGIMCFDKSSLDVKAYLPKDGVAQEEFNRISHFQAEDGTIYFGGLNGITAFHPDDFLEGNETNQKMLLSECLVFNGSEETEISVVANVMEHQSITLKPNDRYLKLNFALPSFSDNHKTLYAWKMDGVYDNWSYQKENTLQFGALPYGNHTLYIKGQSGNGGWSSHELEMQIRVLKPFYLQTWFIGLSIMTVLGSIFLFFRSRTQRLIANQERLEKEVNKATVQIKEQAEELKQLDKVKSRFFANVSHELRTPLTLILGPINSVMKSGELNKRNFGMMKKANRSGKELLKLVASILDLSKMDSGKIELYEQPEFFFPLMDRIVLSFESHAQSKGINFLLDYQADKELQIEIDKNKLEVILNNLLSNAIKFTPDKGGIVTTVKDMVNTILIKVADTGRGIHPKDQNNVFDRFYQSQLADAPIEGGTGIGLALTKEFVQMMGGKIWLESDFGVGTTFFVEFPKKETDTLIMSEKHADYTYANLPEKVEKYKSLHTTNKQPTNKNLATIIVTEDNYSLRDYIITILSPYYNVLAAENGLKTLQFLEEGRDCQLIMSDVMMPEMDGFQLLEELKSNEKYRNIPVVMLTARAEIKDKLKALRIGVDDYLLKPFEEEELLARIENLLNNYKERQSLVLEDDTGIDKTEKKVVIHSKEDMGWLAEVENHLYEHLSNNNYSVSQLALDLSISERQLRRRIKKLTGLSPAQYFKAIRLEKARQFLEQKEFNTVSQTAFAVGFVNISAFSRNFLQFYGKSPSEYLSD